MNSRVLNEDDVDIQSVLDEMHLMAADNFRSWWACSNPPFPSRSEMNTMLTEEDGKYVVVLGDEGAIEGWYYFGPQGEIRAGATHHDPSHEGYRIDMDRPAIDILTMAKEAIVAEVGQVRHMAVANRRVWYGLEVQCDIPRFEQFAYLGPAPTEPPPLPPEAVR